MKLFVVLFFLDFEMFFSSEPLFGESNSSTKKEDDVEEDADDENEDEEQDDDEANKSKPSLFETAAEYEAKRATTHPIANIQGDTSTGEEHEVTKFQVGHCFSSKKEPVLFIERFSSRWRENYMCIVQNRSNSSNVVMGS